MNQASEKIVNREQQIKMHGKNRKAVQGRFLDMEGEFTPPDFPKTSADVKFLDKALGENFIFGDLSSKQKSMLIKARGQESRDHHYSRRCRRLFLCCRNGYRQLCGRWKGGGIVWHGCVLWGVGATLRFSPSRDLYCRGRFQALESRPGDLPSPASAHNEGG